MDIVEKFKMLSEELLRDARDPKYTPLVDKAIELLKADGFTITEEIDEEQQPFFIIMGENKTLDEQALIIAGKDIIHFDKNGQIFHPIIFKGAADTVHEEPDFLTDFVAERALGDKPNPQAINSPLRRDEAFLLRKIH